MLLSFLPLTHFSATLRENKFCIAYLSCLGVIFLIICFFFGKFIFTRMRIACAVHNILYGKFDSSDKWVQIGHARHELVI